MERQTPQCEHRPTPHVEGHTTPGFRVALLVAMAGSWAGPCIANAEVVGEPPTIAAEPAADVADSAVAATQQVVATVPSRRRLDTRGATLDGRIKLLAKELDLSAAQQTQVKKVLLAQREQVAALWNDTSVPAALRVSRTQSIGDRTADQIRALLNETQREKYIKPRARDATVGNAGASVENWAAPGKAR